MYILNDLWHRKITPSERFIRPDSEYLRILHKFSEETDALAKDLPPEKQKLCSELEDLQLKLISISEEDTFIKGFRLGARMILDIIGDYKGQFKTPSEM